MPFLTFVATKLFANLARRRLAELAAEMPGAAPMDILKEFARRHRVLRHCALAAVHPALRAANGVPEPEAVLARAESSLRALKEARARLAFASSPEEVDSVIFEMLSAEHRYAAALREAKKYWDWGVEEAVRERPLAR